MCKFLITNNITLMMMNSRSTLSVMSISSTIGGRIVGIRHFVSHSSSLWRYTDDVATDTTRRWTAVTRRHHHASTATYCCYPRRFYCASSVIHNQVQAQPSAQSNTPDAVVSSSAAVAASGGSILPSSAPQQDYVFKYNKSRDLFERIIQVVTTKDDIKLLSNEISRQLGRPIRNKKLLFRSGGGGKQGIIGINNNDMDDDTLQQGDTSNSSAAAAEGEASSKTKTKWDVKLIGFDEKSKIKVIKEVRAIAGLGLKEAKELVESAPKIIQKDMKIELAEEIQKKLEAVGAKIELV